MPKPPTLEQVSGELRDVFRVWYRTFEAATAKAKAFFEEQARPIEWSVYADLTRYEAKFLLNQAGHDADFDMEDLARNGLKATFAGYPTQIRKSDNGGVPLPGDSQPYLEHLNQQAWLPLDGERKWNLMVLWQVTSLGVLDTLKLALTASATKTSVATYWIENIPHPATTQTTDAGESEIDGRREDIDIGPAADVDEQAEEGE